MATLYIAEYRTLSPVGPSGAQIAKAPPVAEQTVAIGAEAKSLAFNNATSFIRVHADAICSIVIGTSPTATTAKSRLAADQTEYFGVTPGDKLSVISNT